MTSYYHEKKSSPPWPVEPSPALTALSLGFRHTTFPLFKHATILPVLSFEEGFLCVDQASSEIVILLTPLPNYYLFFKKFLI